MKKILVILLAALIFCTAAITLAGCSVFGEKPIDVQFIYNGEVVAEKTVTIFKNQLTPEAEAAGITVPAGYKFMGWSSDPEWTYSEKDENPTVGTVLHRSDVEKIAENGVAKLYAAIIAKSEIPKSDLVVGWYAKTSTSGLNSAMIEATEKAFREYMKNNADKFADYLTANEKTLETLDIVFRAYEGDVATIGANINADEDVDVLLGVGANISTTGGVTVYEKKGNIPMGSKTRYIAMIPAPDPNMETPATIFYAWAQTQEAFDCWKA